MSKFMDEEFLGIITAVSAGIIDEVLVKGEKNKTEIVKFKIETADVDSDEMKNFYPEIITMIESISPCPASKIEFQKVFSNLALAIKPETAEELIPVIAESSNFGRVKISKIVVSIKCDIPCYAFEMSFPVGYGSIKDMYSNYQKKIMFSLSEYTDDELLLKKKIVDFEKSQKSPGISEELF